MDNSEDDPTIFSTHSLPSDPRFWATVTNSYLGTRVYHDTIHVNGVYNGTGGHTHRAILPSPLNVQLEVPAGTERLAETFALDTNTGSFLHTLEGPGFRASQCIYAHRVLPHVLAFSVSIARLTSGDRPVTVLLQSSFSPESPDLDLQVGPDFQGARYLHGHTLIPEQPGEPQQEVHMLWMPVPSALTLGKDEQDRTWDFLTVVGGSQAEAQGCFAEALQLQTRGDLYTVHADAWAQLWAGCGLDVTGPLALRQALRGSLYYLLSELPQPGTKGHISHGLSPGGLSNGSQEECYWGHVFWDQDLWMFPNILMFHPEAARAILEYRIRTLGGALKNAQNLGYRGAKFAWESASTGLEVCPEDIYGIQEVHVNGAVVLAFQLYYRCTQDLQLFQEGGGWDVVSAVAEFWCSRVEWSPQEKMYHLKAQHSRQGPDRSRATVACTPSPACVLLLHWPRTWVCLSPASGWRWLTGSRCHLTLSRTSTLSLMAMCVSMFAVGWMELKEPSRAQVLLSRSFINVTEPFKVWTENADGSGAVNFLTGMGGFLQTALFGCPGFRITEAGVTFDPLCPDLVSRVSVSGISYLGNKFNFTFSKDSVTLEVTAHAEPWAPLLEAELWPSLARLPLQPGHKVSFPHSAGRIQKSSP
ncbi:protein-glucosylgalactosylhydroxylysine glucosidase isoform X3 [Mesocricetus auratus]|uniref:Protein-glucosylgalactosylhydroxylysine glucosidase isoform X3 n=1 Tax=Mesocricetus auratus TaxID=10036 RepID=A0ABM2XYI4_MESAU|nr:protein-glucosylgalactosylhydroxylysine glucosidase isoform X3 [Mesocricetus auratus]